MISIITAIHNQLPMNKLFYKYLVRYTKNKFELIIIDNASSDGSREFFESKGALIISNPTNYSYPYCQNQGIAVAKYEILIFLNNDLIVSKDWDERAIHMMQKKQIDVATCVATERLENNEITHKHHKRWKYLRNPLLFLFGTGYLNLRLMHLLFYGNWERYTEKRYQKFNDRAIDGISGSNVIMKRDCLSKIGLWDERMQGADFDLYLRVKKHAVEYGDIKPVQLLLGIYLHHYCRLTIKHQTKSFADQNVLIPLLQKWNKEEALQLLAGSGLTL